MFVSGFVYDCLLLITVIIALLSVVVGEWFVIVLLFDYL